jgi:hypothetical protein
MSRSFFAFCEPMPLVIGGFSHGTHVHTSGDAGSALEVARRLGYKVRVVRPCPGFDCQCAKVAARYNSIRPVS